MNEAAAIRTYRISASKQCPSVEPIDGQFTHQGETFSEQALTIVGRAIDEGLFYTDDIKAYCWQVWQDAFPMNDQCLTRAAGNDYWKAESEISARRLLLEAMESKVKEAPRGAWAVVRRDWDNGERTGTTWHVLISDGKGQAYRADHAHRWHKDGTLPNFASAAEAMIGMEIYLATNAERARREQARSRHLIAAAGWIAGTVLRNVEIGGKAYSTARVDAIRPSGYVQLELTKRGSRNRWQANTLAQSITGPGGVNDLPAYGQLIVEESEETVDIDV